MPNSEQIRRFWLKWIDRQYAKADPSHLKMRAEISEPREDTETADDAVGGAAKQRQTGKLRRWARVLGVNGFIGGRKH